MRFRAPSVKFLVSSPEKLSNISSCAAPSFRNTAAYGHFGRSEPEFTWEKTDKVADLKTAVGA